MMFNTFGPVWWYTVASLTMRGMCIVRIHCVLGKLRAEKKFQYLSRSKYQCTQNASTCQVRKVTFGEQTSSFFVMCDQRTRKFGKTQKSIQVII